MQQFCLTGLLFTSIYACLCRYEVAPRSDSEDSEEEEEEEVGCFARIF